MTSLRVTPTTLAQPTVMTIITDKCQIFKMGNELELVIQGEAAVQDERVTLVEVHIPFTTTRYGNDQGLTQGWSTAHRHHNLTIHSTPTTMTMIMDMEM